MPNGIVETFKKGYGFISMDGSDEQVFAHQNDIVEINGKSARDQFRHLVEGEKVSFETVQGDKGLKAINIVVTSERRDRDDRPAPRMRSAPRRAHTTPSSNDSLIVKRLIQILSDENSPDGPLLSREEVDYVLNGD